MIGPLEIVILLAILLVVFGGFFYKKLPALGRSAGEGARVGGEKAKELAGVVGEKADSIDTQSIARSAGKGIREAKELKETITGPLEPKPKPAAPAATDEATKPAPVAEPADKDEGSP
jgi:Sec-independent protein translocase protein TatA